MESKRILRSQQGFTLIEIISVLVLLAILAAVAVPRFIDLQADARNSAAQAAVAEGIAQVNMFSAQFILQNGTAPVNLASLTGIGLTTPYAAGDFTITFTAGAAGPPVEVDIAAAGNAGTSVAGGTATGTAFLPQ